jgi:predicted TIM-barrel fold metal-dependent hydrolase
MGSVTDPEVVDFAGHYYPEIPEELKAKHDDIESFDGSPICTDLDTYLQRYKDAGVDKAVLSQPFYMGARGDRDADAVAAVNDALIEEIEPYDELFGLAAIPVAEGGETAAQELERCLDAGYNGGALETMSGGIELIDEEVEPVLEVADRTGAPVMVHPNSSFQEDSSPGPTGADDRWLINSVMGTEFALAESLIKVVHEGVLERYPNLTLVFHHNGGNIPSLLGRLEMWLKRTHRTGGEHLKTFPEFARHMEERVYIDTAGYDGDLGAYSNTFKTFPASSVLFGTDFPYETVEVETFERLIDSMRELLPGVEAEQVLGQNTLDLLINK